MRTLYTSLALALVAAANVSAQGPAAAANKLDTYLAAWEKTMAEVKTMSTTLERVDTDKVFKTATKYTGWAAYMKSGTGVSALNKAIVELKPDGKAEFSEKVICTGTYVYQYIPSKKEIHQHEMPRGKGDVSDNASLGLMFGMKAAAAKERFALSLFKEDAHYVYVDVLPRRAEDKTEFARARLVLNKSTFLPRQVWLEQTNGNTVQWDMPSSASGVAIDARHFNTPRPPDGWKVVPAPKAAASATPRVIRPASP